MYYQLFTTNQGTGKEAQTSCDTFTEVQEEVEKRNPKFVRVEYYDYQGLVGTAWKIRNYATGLYVTYRKTGN